MAPFVEIERFPGGVEFGKALHHGRKITKNGKTVEIVDADEKLVVNGKKVEVDAVAFDENTGIVYLTPRENSRRDDRYKPKFFRDSMLDIRKRWEKAVDLSPGAKLTKKSIFKSLLGLLE